VTDGGDAALFPAVHLPASLDVDTLDIELPFSRVWISLWSRRDGLQPLRHSLVPNAITGREDLTDDLVDEPTITIAHSGYQPHPSSDVRDPPPRRPGRLVDAQEGLRQ
jgi:hypothetical protein